MGQHMQAATTLYLHFSTKVVNSMEIVESFYKQLNNCFMAMHHFTKSTKHLKG